MRLMGPTGRGYDIGIGGLTQLEVNNATTCHRTDYPRRIDVGPQRRADQAGAFSKTPRSDQAATGGREIHGNPLAHEPVGRAQGSGEGWEANPLVGDGWASALVCLKQRRRGP